MKKKILVIALALIGLAVTPAVAKNNSQDQTKTEQTGNYKAGKERKDKQKKNNKKKNKKKCDKQNCKQECNKQNCKQKCDKQNCKQKCDKQNCKQMCDKQRRDFRDTRCGDNCRMQELLNLTDAQANDMKRLKQEHMTNMDSLKSRFDADTQAAYDSYMSNVEKVLSPEQLAKYKEQMRMKMPRHNKHHDMKGVRAEGPRCKANCTANPAATVQEGTPLKR